jgi:DDE superfamily endonuclease
VLDGPLNGGSFRAWVQQFLLPTLRPGDVVVIDNLPAHKVTGIRQMIESCGAKLFYLPPYSPDLNPIESNLPFQNLSPCCAKPLHALCTPCGKPLGISRRTLHYKINRYNLNKSANQR